MNHQTTDVPVDPPEDRPLTNVAYDFTSIEFAEIGRLPLYDPFLATKTEGIGINTNLKAEVVEPVQEIDARITIDGRD